MKFVKRSEYQGTEGEALLKFGVAERFLKGTDALVSFLKSHGASEEAIAKATEELGDGEAFPFVLSNANPDREGDSIDQGGWELDNYRKNPVVLWAHDYSEEPVGRAAMTFVGSDGQLRAIDRFTDKTERGRTVKALYQDRILNAVSVGFRPKEWNFNEERGAWAIDFHKAELLEHSAVPVPAHPEALLEARSAGIDLAPLREFYEKALDAHGFLCLPRKKLEGAWKAAGDRRISVDFSDLSDPVVSPPEGVGEALLEVDTVDLLNELATRGVDLAVIYPAAEKEPAINSESENKSAEEDTISREDIASIFSEVKSSLVAPFKESLQQLKTDLTGRLD